MIYQKEGGSYGIWDHVGVIYQKEGECLGVWDHMGVIYQKEGGISWDTGSCGGDISDGEGNVMGCGITWG